LACILGAWALAGLLGGWTAARISHAHRGGAALVIGGLLTATVIVYATLIPNAEWMTVVGVLLPIPFAVLAALMAMPRNEI
jgi:sugar phosphate permease